MCQERGRNQQAISAQLIQAWYMKHAFHDFRGSWRCISFARTKTKKKSAHQSQAEMARSMNLQRASARAAATRSDIHLPSLGCTETSWMFRTFTSLYSKRKSRTKDHRISTKLKSLIRSNSFERNEDPVSSSSLAELIPSCSVDFDIGNIAMSTDSDYQTTGEPPSRRSSDSFLSPRTCDSTSVATGSTCQRSPFRPIRHHRRKRSIFRAAKVALTGSRASNGAGIKRHIIPPTPTSSGIGIGSSKYSLVGGMRTPSRMFEKQHPPSPAPASTSLGTNLSRASTALGTNLSRATTVTMDTSSSPCKSSTTTSWPENYDMLTETLSTSSWSLRTDSLRREAKVDSRRESKRSSESWRRVLRDDDNKPDCWFDDCRKPSSPAVAFPTSRKDIQQRQASAIQEARHTGKDFQEAIVDIILDNDVNDLVDLEEFLQGYCRLNSLYQDIIQQFFNDLSDDLVNPKVSRAPSVFARLAAANQKSMAAAKAGGGRRSRDFY